MRQATVDTSSGTGFTQISSQCHPENTWTEIPNDFSIIVSHSILNPLNKEVELFEPQNIIL